MVDFYEVYNTVEDRGGWKELTSNPEDGYFDWVNTDDPRYELMFFNWDVMNSSDAPCGLRLDDTSETDSNGYYKEIASITLEYETDVPAAVEGFLDEIEEIVNV